MQNQNVFFNPDPNTYYKIVTVMDANKVIGVGPSQELKLQDYTGADNQKFHIYVNQGKYAFVAPNSTALHVVGDSAENGAVIKLDEGQHKSSYFEIVPITSGQWANKACFIKTLHGKNLDIYGGVAKNGTDVKQWPFNGNANQSWVITPATPTQPQNNPQQQQQTQQQTQQQLADVPAQFVPVVNTDYRIVSVLNQSKAVTVSK